MKLCHLFRQVFPCAQDRPDPVQIEGYAASRAQIYLAYLHLVAGKELGQVLENVELSPLEIPYVTNVTAEYVTDISETKALLAQQVASSVRWQQSVENMIADGVDTFVEIGPGRTLAGFMRKISRDVKVYNVGTWEDVDKVVSELC